MSVLSSQEVFTLSQHAGQQLRAMLDVPDEDDPHGTRVKRIVLGALADTRVLLDERHVIRWGYQRVYRVTFRCGVVADVTLMWGTHPDGQRKETPDGKQLVFCTDVEEVT